MPLKLYRRGRFWWVQGTVVGRRIRRSTGLDDKKQADIVRQKIEQEATERQVYGDAAVSTFAEAVVSYIKTGGEKRFLGPLVQVIGREKLKNINQGTAETVIATVYPEASAATINRQVFTPLAAVINHAAKRDLCRPIKFERRRVKERRRPAATPDQLEAFIAHAEPRLAALAMFMAYTGRRIGECCDLTWKDVNLRKGTALMRDTKNGEDFLCHLPERLVGALKRLERKPGRVFGYPSRNHVYEPWRAACKRAGIPPLTPHEMGRHTFATWMRQYGGADLLAVKEAGGWKSLNMVMRYAKVEPSEAQKAADKLPGAKG